MSPTGTCLIGRFALEDQSSALATREAVRRKISAGADELGSVRRALAKSIFESVRDVGRPVLAGSDRGPAVVLDELLELTRQLGQCGFSLWVSRSR